MSLKKIEQVKNTKWFKLWDILVYGLLVAIIAVLFIVVFAISNSGGDLDGIVINYNGEQVFTYDFAEGEYKILSKDNIEIVSENDARIELVFYTQGRGGFNRISIDKRGRSVRVTDADCSTHKDCTAPLYFLDSNIKSINCPPHKMNIMPFTVVDDGIIRT